MQITKVIHPKPEVPAIPAVEGSVTLTLSMKEARVLRDLFGKSVGRLSDDIWFLSVLDDLFPGAHREPKAEAGFFKVRADYGQGY